jgi:hypothetical protein
VVSIARRGVDLWYEAADELDAPTAAHTMLRRVLGWTLGEEAEAGIAFQHNQPVVVAIEGPRLVCARPEDPTIGDSEAVIALDSIPLDAPLRVGLSISQQTHGAGSFLVKSWTIGEPSPNSFQVDTRTPVSQLQGGEYGGRAVLETAVVELGWALPKVD